MCRNWEMSNGQTQAYKFTTVISQWWSELFFFMLNFLK